MRCSPLFTAGLALTVPLLVASPTQALPLVGGELRVRRTEAAFDCPDEQALGASTMALGARATEASSGPLEVDVMLDRDELGYVARIEATGRKSGEREIRSASARCDSLADATSVALAILFDLLPEEPPPPQPPASAPAPEPVRQATEPARARTAPAFDRPQPPRSPVLLLGAQGGLAVGLLGHAMTGHVGASLRVRVNRWLQISLGAFGTPGRELPHGPGTVSVSLVAGRGEATVTVADNDRIQLALGVGVSSGAIVGSGAGYDHDYTASQPWVAPGILATGRWRLSPRWALTLATTLLAPYRTQTFSVAEVSGTAFEGAPTAVLLELGPELAIF